MITEKELEELNERLKELLEPGEGPYWCGMNYWINQGTNEFEPVGTATCMHDCDIDCARYNYCEEKKSGPVYMIILN